MLTHSTIVLSYLPLTSFIMVACLGHILESIKGLKMKLGLYDRERKGSAHNTLSCIFIQLSPLNHLFFHNGDLSGQSLGSTKGIEMKLGL